MYRADTCMSLLFSSLYETYKVNKVYGYWTVWMSLHKSVWYKSIGEQWKDVNAFELPGIYLSEGKKIFYKENFHLFIYIEWFTVEKNRFNSFSISL